MSRSLSCLRPVRLISILTLAALLRAATCEPEPDLASPPASGSRWQWVGPQLLERRLGLTGQIRSARQMTLIAPFAATISHLHVGEGQSVQAGQLLVSLDPALIESQRRQAHAELLKARSEVLRLQQWASGDEVTRARRQVDSARQTLADTRISLNETRMLFERGIVARVEVDTLRQQLARQRTDWLNAMQEWQATQRRGQGEALGIAQLELANAQARHQHQEHLFAQREIRAPFAGLVMRPLDSRQGMPAMIQAGMPVVPGSALLGLIDRRQLEVISRVQESDLHRLREGMPVEIDSEALPGLRLNGRIQGIGLHSTGPDTQGSAWYEVVTTLDPLPDQAEAAIRPGMSARLQIVLYRNEQGIAVPGEALRGEPGHRYVLWRPALDGIAQALPVTPGFAVVQGVAVEGLTSGYVEVSGM